MVGVILLLLSAGLLGRGLWVQAHTLPSESRAHVWGLASGVSFLAGAATIGKAGSFEFKAFAILMVLLTLVAVWEYFNSSSPRNMQDQMATSPSH
jgi:hypothetical protein